MKAYKIILNEIKEENKWGYEPKGEVGKGIMAFDFKNDEIDLKKGDTVYFQDDYARTITIDGKEYLSTNPANLVLKQGKKTK